MSLDCEGWNALRFSSPNLSFFHSKVSQVSSFISMASNTSHAPRIPKFIFLGQGYIPKSRPLWSRGHLKDTLKSTSPKSTTPKPVSMLVTVSIIQPENMALSLILPSSSSPCPISLKYEFYPQNCSHRQMYVLSLPISGATITLVKNINYSGFLNGLYHVPTLVFNPTSST